MNRLMIFMMFLMLPVNEPIESDKSIQGFSREEHWTVTGTYSCCCDDVKGFFRGWSLWNHLQFLETSGDMKKTFSTKRQSSNKQGVTHRDLNKELSKWRWCLSCTYCWCTLAAAGWRSGCVFHKTVKGCPASWRRHLTAHWPCGTTPGYLQHSAARPRPWWPGRSLCTWPRWRCAQAAAHLLPRFLSQRGTALSCPVGEAPCQTPAPPWIRWQPPGPCRPRAVVSSPAGTWRYPELNCARSSRYPHGWAGPFCSGWTRKAPAGSRTLWLGEQLMWDLKTPLAVLLWARCSVWSQWRLLDRWSRSCPGRKPCRCPRLWWKTSDPGCSVGARSHTFGPESRSLKKKVMWLFIFPKIL